MNQTNIKNMSKEQLIQLAMELQAQKTAQDAGLVVKQNSKGGIYIKDNSFVEYSATKNKNYVAGLNLGHETAKQLFGNKERLEQIRSMVVAITGEC